MAVSSTVANVFRTAFSTIHSPPFIILLFLARFASAHVLGGGCKQWGVRRPALPAFTRAIASASIWRVAQLTVLVAERRALPGQAPAFVSWKFPIKDIACWKRLVTVGAGAASRIVINLSTLIAVYELSLVLDSREFKRWGHRLRRLRSCDLDV